MEEGGGHVRSLSHGCTLWSGQLAQGSQRASSEREKVAEEASSLSAYENPVPRGLSTKTVSYLFVHE